MQCLRVGDDRIGPAHGAIEHRMDARQMRLGQGGRRAQKRQRLSPIACRKRPQDPGRDELPGPEHQDALLHQEPRHKKACRSSRMAKREAGP